MKNSKLFITSLLAAAAMGGVPAFGANVTYTGSESITDKTLGSYTLTDTITMGTEIATDSPSQNLGSMTAGGNFYPGAYTLMFWLNAESLPTESNITLFTYGGTAPAGNDGSNALTLNSDGTLSFGQGKTNGASFTFGTAANRVQTTTGNILSAGTTYHIALVNNGGNGTANTATLYIDGVAVLDNVTVNLNMGNGNANTVFPNLNLASSSNISYGDAWLYAGASNADAIQKLATHTSYDLTWAGGASGNWNTSDANWQKDDESVAFGGNDNVTFNTSGEVTVAIDSAGVVAKRLTVSAGTLSFTGGVATVRDGVFIAGTSADNIATLKLSAENQRHLGVGTVFNIGENGVLDINGRSETAFKIILNGGTLTNTGNNVDGGNKQLTGGLSLTADSKITTASKIAFVNEGYAAQTFDFGGHVLTKDGSNMLSFINTTITNGTLRVTEGSFTAGTANFDATKKQIALGEGAKIEIVENGAMNAKITSMAAGTVLKLEGTGTFQAGSGVTAGTQSAVTISGSVGAADNKATIVVAAGNAVTYSNSASGALNADIEISGDGSRFTQDGANASGQLGTAAIAVKDGGTLALGTNRWIIASGNSLSLDGGNITGTSQNSQGNLDFSNAASVNVTNTFSKESTISASIRLNENVTFNVADSATLNITGKIENGSPAKLVKDGAGTLKLDIADDAGAVSGDFSGGVTVSAGTLVVAHASALGTGTTTVAEGATLELVANVTVTDVSGGIQLASGAKIVVDMANAALSREAREEIVLDLISGTGLSYGGTDISSENVNELLGSAISLKNWDNAWTQSLSYENNKLQLTLTIPEPSTFGLLAGLGALALAGTRRRRRKA